MQLFQTRAQLMKQPVNQIREPIHPPRKARPAQKPPDKSEFVQNKARFFTRYRRNAALHKWQW